MTRPPAPPYRGEGPHALWHVSELPGITHVEPRPSLSMGLERLAEGNVAAAPAADTKEPLVWAVGFR